MKRILALVLFVTLMVSAAYAEGWGDLLGGLSSLFSSDNKVTYGIGEEVEIDELVLKLTDVMVSNGNGYYKPSASKQYVILQFDVKNKSDETVVLSTLMNFTVWCDDEVCIIDTNALATAMLSGKYQLDCGIDSGKKVTGVIGYEIPKDWEELKIEFRKELLFGDSVTFLVERNAN